ncbi:hypothetical protein LIP_2149 [Limnochorda pilosa]|uniref:Polysaccharide biosynthesis protein CapD-like domain-containing protein n=1 Tax=Limnochorda pilosa TaxID=1555112 RepID=A0A0K2SLK8_LIMPI|nr:polysaccharide biosynthesis protein [Limnochorda pilosa]BAS27990.1 hypothetical protein LIP_2149 [Limnochorda pilosa]
MEGGAGYQGRGSIGSELCRQVARCAPGHLILLGHGENSIFETLEELRTAHPQIPLVTAIADMRDERKVEAVFAAHRPAVVFHAAAHKHVPLKEAHPDEAATNNVLGTLKLCLTADRFGTERFVMASTDKAVNRTTRWGPPSGWPRWSCRPWTGGAGPASWPSASGTSWGAGGA